MRDRRAGVILSASPLRPHPPSRSFSLRDTYWPLLLLLPLALIALLRGAPHIDERWENHPAHFWIVLVDRGRLPRARDRDQRGGARAGATRGCS